MSNPHRVKIHFLGVFETVLAIGSRLKVVLFHPNQTVSAEHQFHVGERPPALVKTARQALGIDEQRKVFAPEIWKGPASSRQSLQQRWFPGVHSNVGGGYEKDGVANLALHWMTGEAAAVGLDFNQTFLGKYRQWVGDTQYNSFGKLYRLLGRRLRDLDAGSDHHLELHESVLELVKFNSDEQPPYRPRNLLPYLAKRPVLWAGLPEDVLEEVRKLC
jgi:hypothetical protein